MRTASAIARYLAGVIFLIFGLNGFLNFIPLPSPSGGNRSLYMTIGGTFDEETGLEPATSSLGKWAMFCFQ